MNPSEMQFLAITSHFFKAREKSCVQDVIGFNFASQWAIFKSGNGECGNENGNGEWGTGNL